MLSRGTIYRRFFFFACLRQRKVCFDAFPAVRAALPQFEFPIFERHWKINPAIYFYFSAKWRPVQGFGGFRPSLWRWPRKQEMEEEEEKEEELSTYWDDDDGGGEKRGQKGQGRRAAKLEKVAVLVMFV